MKFAFSSIATFLDELGSAKPSPGGGTAAALVAATGVALVEMVSRINKAPSARVKKLAVAKKRLLVIMELDTKAFENVFAFYKKKDFGSGYQRALKQAAGAPLEICVLSADALELALAQKKKTSRWLISDLWEAAELLSVAYASARLNVEINLCEIKDDGFKRGKKQQLDRLAKEISQLRKKILSKNK